MINYGVGGINIDECRVETNGELIDNHITAGTPFMRNREDYEQLNRSKLNQGRFPANIILTYGEEDKQEVCSGFPTGSGCKPHRIYSSIEKYDGWGTITRKNGELVGYADTNDSTSRYFKNCKYTDKDI